MIRHCRRLAALVPAFAIAALVCPVAPAAAWEPTKPIEFVIPAGTGGGAGQMGRLIAGVVEKDPVSPPPAFVADKAGGAGPGGFLLLKAKKGHAPPQDHT